MAKMYETIRSLDLTNQDLVKDTLTQFFTKFSRNPQNDQIDWLHSIELILTRCPKYCLSHRNIIENYLIQFLDSDHNDLVISAAKCCHLLQQVRPTNEKSANAKSSWRQQMSLLCSSAHTLMAAAFPGAVDLYKAAGHLVNADTSSNILQAFASIASTYKKRFTDKNRDIDYATNLSPADKNSLLCRRLTNLLVFVQAMLVEVYPVAKPVRPQTLLDVIVRALSITSSQNSAPEKESDRQIVAKNIASVKIQALRTLDALIVCLGPNLIPYSPLVFRVATQTIRWSNDNATKESSEVLSACHRTLTLWLTVLRCHKLDGEAIGGRGTGLNDEIVDSILAVVAPKLDTVTLTMSNQSMKNLSKKARRKMATTILNQSAIANHIPGEKNKEKFNPTDDNEIVLSALECLEVLLTTCGIFLKPITHRRIQDVLVRACYGLASDSDAARGLALCRALEASRVSLSSDTPGDTSHCLHVFSRLINSCHADIAQFCSRALLSIRASLHGGPPTLTYAPLPLQIDLDRERAMRSASNNGETSYQPQIHIDLEANNPVLEINDDDIPYPGLSKGNEREPTTKFSVEELRSLTPEMGIKMQRTGEFVSERNRAALTSLLGKDKVPSATSNEIINISDSPSLKRKIEEDKISLSSQSSTEVQIDDSNGVDLTSADSDCEDHFKTGPVPQPSGSNSKMRLIDSDKKKDNCFHELVTQLPSNISDDSDPVIEEDSNHSLEISYDHNGSRGKEVRYLEKMEGENLPSTNETDDVITCGQAINNSQDSGKSVPEKQTEVPVNDENSMEVDAIKVNGVDSDVIEVDDAEKTNEKEKILNVEDMLADFVDEKAN